MKATVLSLMLMSCKYLTLVKRCMFSMLKILQKCLIFYRLPGSLAFLNCFILIKVYISQAEVMCIFFINIWSYELKQVEARHI